MELFWELYQQGRIGDAAADAAEARTTARNVKLDVAELREQAERSLLISAAIWSLVRERFSLTDADLAKRIDELDASDGKLDGRLRRPPAVCNACGRSFASRFPKCIYCGEPVIRGIAG